MSFAVKNEWESASFSVVNELLTEDHAEAMQRKRYSSDLTDSQWQKTGTVLDTSRHRQHDLRHDIVDGLLYLVKTGCQWRMLPGGFAPRQTVYYYFRKWKKGGVIERLLGVARRGARQEAGREPDPSAVIIDCQSVPITRSGGLCGFDGNKKVKGRKRHIAVDTQGWTWAVGIHPANQHESQHALALLEEADEKSGRLETVFADKAYRGDLEDDLDEALGLRMEITEPKSRAEVGRAGLFGRAEALDCRTHTRLVWRLAAALKRVRAAGGDERSNGSARFATIGLQPPLTAYQNSF